MKHLAPLLAALALAPAVPLPARAGAAPALVSEARLRQDMRKLWEDHVTYTAFFYTAALRGGDDAAKLAERLLRNQDEIGNAVKPFYGQGAGDQLAGLLRDHILIAADLISAAKAGDAAGQEKASRRWHQNADAIADLLAGANPHWKRGALGEALHAHLAMTTEAVAAKLRGDTAAAIAAYDRGHEHMLAVADVLSAGLVSQFPERFER